MAKKEAVVIHAQFNGGQIVRYDDEWYVEPRARAEYSSSYSSGVSKKGRVPKKKKLSGVQEAAELAAYYVEEDWTPEMRSWSNNGSQIFFDVGCEEFDEIVRHTCPMLYVETKEQDLGHGHKVWGMKCPGCREWMQITESQRKGLVCTDHQRADGGCGFHGYTFGSHVGYICDVGDVVKELQKKRKEVITEEKKKVKKSAKAVA